MIHHGNSTRQKDYRILNMYAGTSQYVTLILNHSYNIRGENSKLLVKTVNYLTNINFHGIPLQKFFK